MDCDPFIENYTSIRRSRCNPETLICIMRKGLDFIGKLVFFMDFFIQSAKINKDTYFLKLTHLLRER